jgi:glyoxylase-like metal-dependent hydrolase (beta-lactamase superfamily II)
VVTKLALGALCLSFACASAMAQDAKTTIADAQKALGNPTSITYSGSAKDVSFQQCGANATQMACQGTHDPMRPIASYVRVVDLAAPTTRQTGATNNIGPGGSTAVTPGTFFQQVTPQQADLSQPWAQSLDLYLTPWGFLKGAAANNATASRKRVDGKQYTVLSWSPAVKAPSGKSYTINGYVSDKNYVERVETWVGDNIMGDMHVLATYSGWKDFGGTMAPVKVVQTRGGWPFFQLDVAAAKANPTDLDSLAPAPANRPAGPPPGPPAAAMNVTTEKLGDGLWRLTTGAGSYDSLVIEFESYIMMLEAGQSVARGSAYIAEAKKLAPNKPIRYVVNTHPHSDHTGGLPALVAEGAMIVTQRNNKDFLEGALNTPRTLLDDVLAQNPKKARIETVSEKKVYTDGTRTVELYHIYPAPHSNGLLVAYIPKEKVLFQGDFSVTPGQPANDHVKALVPALEKLKLVDFDRYINVHAPAAPQTKADVWKAVGKS